MNLTSIYYLHEIGGKKNQEDYIWPVPGAALPENKIFIICDGVGGSENGEIASRMIAEYAGNILSQTPREKISAEYINNILEAARRNLVTHALEKGLNKDMATTFSLLVLFSDKAFIAWCGDSRIYHIRNGEILYKTSDHSLVNTLVKSGEITEEEALTHPQKHIILKAITGDDSIIEADTHWINDLTNDDYFMLCTDGLLENITDADLKTLLSENNTNSAEIIPAIQKKCFGKTRDNYSMYLLQINLQETAIAQKPVKSNGVWWLAAVTVLAAVAGFFFLNRKDKEVETLPAVPITHDSATKQSTVVPVKKDTILNPGKNDVPDSELNKNDPEENKIIPQPLPETKTVSDSGAHKKDLRNEATDTLSKHGKPLN